MDVYYRGYLDALLYMQADLDVEANFGESPVLKARLPDQYYDGTDWELFELAEFAEAINEMNAKCHCIYWRIVGRHRAFSVGEGETRIEICGTEGYQGLPSSWSDVVNPQPAELRR